MFLVAEKHMSITVVKPGLLTTIQDDGRKGYEKFGIVVSGAMDIFSLKLANILVGNDINEACLEATVLGPELKISENTLIAITGAELSPTINGISVENNKPIFIKTESILSFKGPTKGCRAYIAFAGGFLIPKILESKSTYIRGKIGGLNGRALIKGDTIKIGKRSNSSEKIINSLLKYKEKSGFIEAMWFAKNPFNYTNQNQEIRVFEDMQYNLADKDSLYNFYNNSYKVTSKSDRMGYRLEGSKIKFKEKIEMISGEVSLGTIQVPPDGNPIILLADRQTAGGYPKFAHVIKADIPLLAQLSPNSSIRFKKVSMYEAEKLYYDNYKYLNEIKNIINLL